MTDTYDLSPFSTDKQLHDHIKKGQVDKYIYRKRNDDLLDLNEVFIQSTPSVITRDSDTLLTDIQEVKVAHVIYYLTTG